MHSKIVGGSSAKRLINCPGSRALVEQMPAAPESEYAAEGSRLHHAIHMILLHGEKVSESEGKLLFALNALNDIDPGNELEFVTEARVDFGSILPGVFGSCDLIGRIRNRAIVLDWKFGDGVIVEPEENEQLLFYAAAAMRTEQVKWAFEGVDTIDLVIVQPPYHKTWTTTVARVKDFERDLYKAVQASFTPDAKLNAGDHCRWCEAKPVCPLVTGQLERAIATKMNAIDKEKLGNALAMAILAKEWAKSVEALAQDLLEKGQAVPGWKLVPKRATRQWVNERQALAAFEEMGLDPQTLTTLKSPAQIEKIVKKLPDGLAVAVSSGNTIAPESDPRPEVLTIGQSIRSAFSKLGA